MLTRIDNPYLQRLATTEDLDQRRSVILEIAGQLYSNEHRCEQKKEYLIEEKYLIERSIEAFGVGPSSDEGECIDDLRDKIEHEIKSINKIVRDSKQLYAGLEGVLKNIGSEPTQKQKEHIKVCMRLFDQTERLLSVSELSLKDHYRLKHRYNEIQGNVHAAKYFEFRVNQQNSDSSSYLNLGKFLYDPELADTDALCDVALIQAQLNKFEDEYLQENWIHFKRLISRKCNNRNLDPVELEYWNTMNDQDGWFLKMMRTKEAHESPESIQKRVIAVLKIIISEDTTVENRLKFLKIIADNGIDCQDRAIVGLEQVESAIEIAMAGKDFIVNVLVKSFKQYLIQSEIATRHPGQECTETYLYYSIRLNEVLGLDQKTEFMNYADLRIKMSDRLLLNLLYGHFTQEDLIGFISNDENFRLKFDDEYMLATEAVRDEINDLFEKTPNINRNDPRLVALYNTYQYIVRTFYEQKAEACLLERGFLVKELNYSDPKIILEVGQKIALVDELPNSHILLQHAFLYICAYMILGSGLAYLCLRTQFGLNPDDSRAIEYSWHPFYALGALFHALLLK